MSLDAETLHAYRQRWQIVAQMNDSERRRATVTERWHQLNSLLRMSAALGLHPRSNESEVSIPRQHWNQLRQMYLATRQEGLL